MKENTKTKNNKTKFSDLQELVKCCDDVIDSFGRLHEQLIKIIGVKKQLSKSAGSNVTFGQAQDAIDATANLEKINAKLSGAIDEVKQLGQQVQLLLQVDSVAAVDLKATNAGIDDRAE